MSKKIFKKSSKCLILGILVVVSLSGCGGFDDVGGKETAISVYKRSDLRDLSSIDLSVDFDVDGNVLLTNGSYMDVVLKSDAKQKLEMNRGSYTEGIYTFEYLGLSENAEFKEYSQVDNNNTKYSYICTNNTLEWQNNVSEEYFNINKLFTDDLTFVFDKLLLMEDTELYNNKESFHISGKVSGDSIKFNNLNMSNVSIFADFYFAKEDYSFLGVTFNLQDTDFTRVFKDNGFISEDNDTGKVEFDKFKVDIRVIDVNNYTFELPVSTQGDANELSKGVVK